MAQLITDIAYPPQWIFADGITSNKGQRRANLTDAASRPVQFTLTTSECALHLPFAAGTFDNDPAAVRLNLEVDVPSDSQTFFCLKAIDKWCVDYVTKHADRLLASIPAGDVERSYRPLLTHNEKYSTHRIRLKANIAGHRCARVWDSEQKCLGSVKDVDLQGSWGVPLVCITNLWQMGKTQWGLVCELQHLQETTQPGSVCPF